jgi:hypothetical protein
MEYLFYVFLPPLLTCCNGASTNKAVLNTPARPVIEQTSIELINRSITANDSLFLWTDTMQGSYITRIQQNGFFKFLFWHKGTTAPVLQMLDSVAVLDFLKDSLFDVNGDKYNDFIIHCQTRNGQCQPDYAKVFCFDRKIKGFMEIQTFNTIPNPKFYPLNNTVEAQLECMMKKDIYKFKWRGLTLDTVYIRSEDIK